MIKFLFSYVLMIMMVILSIFGAMPQPNSWDHAWAIG